MLLNDGLLGRTECLRVLHPLVDESAGGSDQPDVVEPSSQLERLAVGCGELQEVGHRSAQSEDSAGLSAQGGIERLEHLQAELNRVMQIKFQRLVHLGEPLTVIGLGNSTLDDVLAEVIRPAGRVLAPDQEPEKGFFYRSDHFEFAKQGVPALYTEPGVQFVGKDSTYGMKKREEYTSRDYHQPSDEVKPDWDLTGAVEDTQVLLQVGYRVANGTVWPTWKPGTEFKALRDAVLKALVGDNFRRALMAFPDEDVPPLAELEAQIAERDRLDSSRALAPLLQADDAVELVTDGMEVAAVIHASAFFRSRWCS